jgi:Arc/MetJ-type ribon-helix-helix transcriptional regulator
MYAMKPPSINLSLPRKLLNRADREAERESRSRSELMREALRAHLDRKARWESIFSFFDGQTRKLRLKPQDVENAIGEVRGRN